MTFDILRQRAGLLSLVAATALATWGCEPPPKTAPSTPAPGAGQGSGATSDNAPAVSPNTPTPPAGVPTPSDSGAVPSANDTGGIPPELIKQVEELVRLTKEYNSIAATIQTRDDYVKNLDKLSALDEQLQPYVLGLEVDQAKLSPAARAEFDRKYFEGLAKPVVEEKRGHMRRFPTLQ